VVTEISVDPNGAANPVDLVRGAILTACGAAVARRRRCARA